MSLLQLIICLQNDQFDSWCFCLVGPHRIYCNANKMQIVLPYQVKHRRFLSVLEILSSVLYVRTDNLSSGIPVCTFACISLVTPCCRFRDCGLSWLACLVTLSLMNTRPADMKKALDHACVVFVLR